MRHLVRKPKAVVAFAALCAVLAATTSDATARVRLLATGGTIAGVANPSGSTAYVAGKLTAAQLTAQLPQLAKIAQVSTEQVLNVASQDLRDADRLLIAERVLASLRDPNVDAVVVTHGTDTLEETAFFLDLVTPGAKPIVLTGAMRPADAVSADGPGNLLDAFTVATSPLAQNRGVLVVLNEMIYTARSVTKLHGSVGGFGAPFGGIAGQVHRQHVRFTQPAPASAHVASFDLGDVRARLPDVEIVTAYAGMSGVLIDAARKASARAIVIAGVGEGNMSRAARDATADAVRAGVFVVRASRVPGARVDRNNEIDDDTLGTVVSDTLSPQKVRILCQLALTRQQSAQSLQQLILTVSGKP